MFSKTVYTRVIMSSRFSRAIVVGLMLVLFLVPITANAGNSSEPTLQETEDWININSKIKLQKRKRDYRNDNTKLTESIEINNCILKMKVSLRHRSSREEWDRNAIMSMNVGQVTWKLNDSSFSLRSNCKSRFGGCITAKGEIIYYKFHTYNRVTKHRINEAHNQGEDLFAIDKYWGEKFVEALNHASTLCEPKKSRDEELF